MYPWYLCTSDTSIQMIHIYIYYLCTSDTSIQMIHILYTTSIYTSDFIYIPVQWYTVIEWYNQRYYHWQRYHWYRGIYTCTSAIYFYTYANGSIYTNDTSIYQWLYYIALLPLYQNSNVEVSDVSQVYISCTGIII